MKVVSAGSVGWELERPLHRAMNPLERLLRMRQGAAVPPPVTVELSERP